MIVPIKIRLKWVPLAREWHVESVIDTEGPALQEFKDRKEVRDFFVGCSKKEDVTGTLLWKASGPINTPTDAQVKITITWGGSGWNKWILSMNGKEIGKLLSCKNIARVFHGINKDKPVTGWLGWKRTEGGV